MEYDRSVKLPLYARAGIPEVWVADLASNEIESHSAPQHGAYGLTRRYHHGDELASESVPGLKLGVSGLLGEA